MSNSKGDDALERQPSPIVFGIVPFESLVASTNKQLSELASQAQGKWTTEMKLSVYDVIRPLAWRIDELSGHRNLFYKTEEAKEAFFAGQYRGIRAKLIKQGYNKPVGKLYMSYLSVCTVWNSFCKYLDH